MAWVQFPTPAQGPAVQAEETITLPSSATTEYSSEIDFLKVDPSKNNKYVTFVATTSTVTGSNIDYGLYGTWKTGGTKFLLLDAFIADQSTSGSAQTTAGVVDLNAYPAAYYYLGHTADTDESLNTVSYYVIYN